MALHTSTPTHATASHSAASAIGQVRTSPKARTASADDQGDGDFAAQLMRARPQDDAKPADTDTKPADAKAKDASQDDDKDTKDAKDAADAKTPDGQPPAVDPNAQLPVPQPVAPTTLSLAAKTAPDPADAAADALGALRKGAKGARDGKDAALGALGLGKDGKPGDATALAGKGSTAAADFTAALGKAEGAGNSATDTRDAMAALLPQADPVSVQAGTVGASPNAALDAGPAANAAPPAAPAQATLPMAPQSPAFVPALGQQIEVWMKGGIQHAEVQLSPQDLGPIRVKIEMSGAQARVEMAADVPSTRDALQQALPQLADSLGQVGLSLSGGGVSDQSTRQQAQSEANAAAFAGAGGAGGRPGAGGRTRGGAGDAGGEDFAVASAARQAAQRRGLLDMYA